ncbi:hypothetical protein M0802_016122 [Mischocyttarus mexicanus]|nr:hypothetical protein M0802_016122 [Mischocyttarus mexicanus]
MTRGSEEGQALEVLVWIEGSWSPEAGQGSGNDGHGKEERKEAECGKAREGEECKPWRDSGSGRVLEEAEG